MKFRRFDVMIVGTGISGIYAALNLDKQLDILMLSKKELTLCNSALAQGGVAAVMDKDNDNYELHIKDTLIAGHYENNIDNVRILVEQGPTDVQKLQDKYGVEFDHKDDGSISLTREGGHSRRRIAHHKDSTGFEIETSLIEQVQQLKNVSVVNNSVLCRLERSEGLFFADVLTENGHEYYCANYVILATGGIGRVYNYTTNSAIATGDGIQLAYNLGAEIKNLSYVQFHPTAYADKNKEDRECFLISEAVRGEGAYLLNCNKERFMHKYEPERLELAPRDVVSKCIIEEQKLTGSDEFWLDISHKEPEFVKGHFPMIYNKVLEKGYDMTKGPIPIYPCQHYLMGGINVDGKGATNIEGLYAAGECSHTGVHGKNRLASNSLLEALVFSRLISEDINAHAVSDDRAEAEYDMPSPEGKALPDGIKTEVRNIMQRAYFIHPNYSEAEKGLARITELKELLENGGFEISAKYVETKSLVTVAYIILTEVMERKDKE
ncbi:MAG: FAD-dependent oxidoreductase [Ruminococcaceae bacterium]|nr:FAD-dependent oxidoreductase [Oscillospiraceae bacterium]